MLLIYAEKKSPRLEYILQTLFDSIGLSQWQLCFDKKRFSEASEAAYINYSSQRVRTDEIFIQPHALLFEKQVQKQLIDMGSWNEYPTFFQSNSDLPFDIFAASFYLVSRYEEYLPFKEDKFNRFTHTASLAYKKDFIHLPLVNIWMEFFGKNLQSKFPNLSFESRTFSFTPTYDIDIAYRFKRRAIQNIISFLYRCIRLDISDVKEQIRYFSGKGKDTYDVYDWLNQLHEKTNQRPIYFFLVANKKTRVDNNISVRFLGSLIRKIFASGKIGLHPSAASADIKELVKEKRIIDNITKCDVTKSRQHYIKLKFPKTYEELLSVGVREDYSMGYSTVNGFRASFAHPFYWFNVAANETTPLKIFPFCFMDGCSFVNQRQTAKEGYAELMDLFQAVKKVHGHMITVFHNTLLTEEKEKIEFRKGYEQFLKAVTV